MKDVEKDKNGGKRDARTIRDARHDDCKYNALSRRKEVFLWEYFYFEDQSSMYVY